MGYLEKIHEDFFTLLREREAKKEQKELDNREQKEKKALNSRRRTLHDLFYKKIIVPYHDKKIKEKKNLKKIIQKYIANFSDDDRKILLLLAIRNGSIESVKLLLGKKLDLNYSMSLEEFEQKSTDLMQRIPEKDGAIIAAQTNSLSAAFLPQERIPEEDGAIIAAQTNSLSAGSANTNKEDILLSPLKFAQNYKSLQIRFRQASPVLKATLQSEEKFGIKPDKSLTHQMLNQKENIDNRIQELLKSHLVSSASSDTLGGHDAMPPPPPPLFPQKRKNA